MAYVTRKLISVLAGGALAAILVSNAGAQSLGGIVGGITDGLGVTADVSVGGNNVSADVDVGGPGNTGSNSVSADVDIGLGNGLFGNSTGTSVNANATVGTSATTASLNIGTPGIPGLALPNVDAEANIGIPGLPGIGVNIGLNPPVTPNTPVTPPVVVNSPVRPDIIASLSAAELARYQVKCAQILASPASFGQDLVSLCKLIRTASR